MLTQARRVSFVTALLAAIVLWLANPTYEDICKQYTTPAKENCLGYEVVPSAARGAIHWLDTHEGAVTALSTLTIAIFTITLWWATRGLLRISGGQLGVAERALIDLERPYLYADFSRDKWAFDDCFPIEGGLVGIRFSPITPVQYWLYNGGRTPAILIHQRHEIVVTGSDQVSPFPIDANRIRPRDILPLGTAIHRRRDCTVDFLAEHYGMSELYEDVTGRGIFLIGFVRYMDIFRNKHVTGFCALYDHRAKHFMPHGDKRYNYTKDEGKEPPS